MSYIEAVQCNNRLMDAAPCAVGGSVSIMCNDEDDEGGTSEVYETSPDRVHPPLPYHERPENWFKVGAK